MDPILQDKRDSFREVATNPDSDRWERGVRRRESIYRRNDDIRDDFERDYNRILHSTAYRRLKQKTQVFFAAEHDHVCTRIEHVNHVSSISYTICRFLGLNADLAKAIATGHDLGHAPFGHEGEKTLDHISRQHLGESFWHERNGLRFVDLLETLPDQGGRHRSLNLTYAVRDGIVCHCGEVHDESLKPRDEYIDLLGIRDRRQQPAPFTWEGCVVRIADKISFLGRDIEDALELGLLDPTDQVGGASLREINNGVLIHRFIIDLCHNSVPGEGLRFSAESYGMMGDVREFSRERIYSHPRLEPFKRYAEVVLKSLHRTLADFYDGPDTLQRLRREGRYAPTLTGLFCDWLTRHSTEDSKGGVQSRDLPVYDIGDPADYQRAIIDYISRMSDSFAIRAFRELRSFDAAPSLYEG